MKYSIFFLLTALSLTFKVSAFTPITIPSGQQLYFELATGSSYSPADGRAIIYPPYNAAGYNGWTGYTKPGGDVIIPDTITYNGLKYVVIEIGNYAFRDCNSITSIVIPNTVSRIGYAAFSGCTSLHSITIGKGLKRIDQWVTNSYVHSSMIQNCTSLDSVYYNADSCYIGQLFSGNNGQHTAVIIGDNVRYIPSSMFQASTTTTSIESVIIGSSVSAIGNGAFANCSNMRTITFRTHNPPSLGNNVFLNIIADSVICNIPCGRTTAYFNQWSTLFNYTEASIGYSINVSSNNNSWGTAEIIQQPSCSGVAIIGATASCGYYFVRWSDGNSDNPRTLSLQDETYLTAIFASSYNLPDTVFVHDTTTVNNYIHDTTYLPIYLHDTVLMIEYIHDTTYLPQYIHDTAIVNIYSHDTIYLPQYIHDTTIVTEFDTTYITLHDTTIVNNHIRDTIYLPQYIHDTTYITLTDTVTNTVYDTITNTFYDTIVVYNTDTLWLHDTVFVHDTIYIRDTIVVGVDKVDAINAKIYTSRGQIVVDGAESNTVWLYDVNGRVLATKQDAYSSLRFDVPASGAYMVRIGNHPARKVVVIR